MAFFKVALLAALAVLAAAAPGGKDDKASQPYEFEYAVNVASDPHHGGSSQQGHAEARVGDHSIGNYYVQLPEQGAATRVSYTTDLWGFHPVVSYSSKGSTTRFAFGDRAIAALNAPDNPANGPVSIDSAAKVAHSDVSETLHNIAAAGNPPIPGHLSQELDKAQHNIAVAQSHGHGKLAAGPVLAHAPIAPLGAVAHAAPLAAIAPVAPLNVARPAYAPARYAAYAPAAPLAAVHQQPLIPAGTIAPFTRVSAGPQFVQGPQYQQYQSYAPLAPVVATAAPLVRQQYYQQTALPIARPTPLIASAALQPQFIQQQRPFNIYEQQRQVKPIVVAEFNSNNHLLAHHAPVTAAPTIVSTTPAPFVSYASPTPTPFYSAPHPVVHSEGGFIASTVGPAAYSVTPAPLRFVSSTPQPYLLNAHHQAPIVVDRPVEVTKFVEKQVPVEVTKYVDRPVEVTKFVDRPVQVTKYVDRPVEVIKHVDRPVEVTKYIDRPVQVIKHVDRPVEVTKYVDRPVQVTKFVDRPVEVTKYVDRPVEVTKFVDRPVQVTKYVDRPVEVIKHVQVEKPVYVPGPTVEKHVPVPYTKVVHVDRPVPHAVAVPYAVPQPIAVPHPVPVDKPVPVPYAQYVVNVPYSGRFAYGSGRGQGLQFNGRGEGLQFNGRGEGLQFNGRGEGLQFNGRGQGFQSYGEAAQKLDAWKADQINAFKGGFSGYQSEALLRGYGSGCNSGCGGSRYRTESADIKGFKVSKTYLADSDIVPNPGPTKVTLTLEPHVHKTELGRSLCAEHGPFKPPLVPSRLLSQGVENDTW